MRLAQQNESQPLGAGTAQGPSAWPATPHCSGQQARAAEATSDFALGRLNVSGIKRKGTKAPVAEGGRNVAGVPSSGGWGWRRVGVVERQVQAPTRWAHPCRRQGSGGGGGEAGLVLEWAAPTHRGLPVKLSRGRGAVTADLPEDCGRGIIAA